MTIKPIAALLLTLCVSGNRLLLESELSDDGAIISTDEWRFVGLNSFGFVRDGKCESYGMITIQNLTTCQNAATALAETIGMDTPLRFFDATTDTLLNRPTGCSYRPPGESVIKGIVVQRYGNKGDCNLAGYAGCFCEIASSVPSLPYPLYMPSSDDHTCTFNVISVSQNGKYFAFDRTVVMNILGGESFNGHRFIFNKETDERVLVYMYTLGEDEEYLGHARASIAEEGDWFPGDTLALEEVKHSDFECTDWCQAESDCDLGYPARFWDCFKQNMLFDGYYYEYNNNRGTPDAVCGEEANCFCCRAFITQYSPVNEFC